MKNPLNNFTSKAENISFLFYEIDFRMKLYFNKYRKHYEKIEKY
jgi:hypothetical protein